MVGAGRILKNALAVAASAACLSRSRRSRVTDQDSTATDSDSDFPSIILRNQLLSSSVAGVAVFIRTAHKFAYGQSSCVATAEARFLRAGKKNGAFCAETDRKAAQRAVPVGEPGKPYGHREQRVLKYMSGKKRQVTQPAHNRLVLTDHHGR